MLKMCSRFQFFVLLQDVIDVIGALESGSAAKSQEVRDQSCQQQGQILQWLRHKLPTNTELCQVKTV